ncbi:MAG: hypothetical protein JW836_11430 [Deltaproteobacteria bacterium]|nr:hypothetical protein [Deltaproteobacteria bacterium]
MISKITYINIALAFICAFFLLKAIQVWQNEPLTADQFGDKSSVRQEERSSEGGPRGRTIESRMPPKSAFENIAAKNLFSVDRTEYLPPAPQTEPVEEEKAPKVDGRRIQLFGVILTHDSATALITDPSVKSGKRSSLWVKPGDNVGQLKVDSIEPDSVVFVDETQKKFRVVLHVPNRVRSAPATATPTAGPTVVTTQPTAAPSPAGSTAAPPKPRPAATTTQPAAEASAKPAARAGTKTGEGSKPEQDYVTVKTPFGEMRQPKR